MDHREEVGRRIEVGGDDAPNPGASCAKYCAKSLSYDNDRSIIHRKGDGTLVKTETSARRVNDRLKADGWTNIGGGRHDRFVHKDRPEMMIVVPRHRELSPGVARSIAKAAGWHDLKE